LDSLDWLPPIWFLRIVLQQYKTEMSFKEMQREVLYAGKWLTMKAVHYKNPNNTPYVWECVERTTKCGDVDGVDVFAVLKMSDFPDRVVLELQYRPPVGKFVHSCVSLTSIKHLEKRLQETETRSLRHDGLKACEAQRFTL
jgi:hypothetical protein